jgi:hypothetical protein
MGTTKKDKLFTWLKVLHKIEDLNETNLSDSKKLKELNKLYYIRERK